jgi:transcriptional regulator with XRE-family HTH domain
LTRPFDYEFATVGRNIQALRISSGKDIETVAKALSIGSKRLERIEIGLCGDIRLTLMEKISKYFDTPIYELVKEIPMGRFAAADSPSRVAELPKSKNEIDDSSKTHNASL